MEMPEPIRVYEEWVEYDKLGEASLPEERAYSERKPEVEEEIRKAIREGHKSFFDKSPMMVSKSLERD